MKDRAMTLGLGSAMAAALAVSISLYSTARAQTATQVPPAAGPRGVAAARDLQRPNPTPYAQQFAGGGGGSIAADQGMVYVLRGNLVFILGRDGNGRFRVLDQVELPGGRPNANGPNPFRPNPVPPRQQGNPPPPGK